MLEVEYIDHMGSDIRVVNAARVSYGKRIKKLTKKDVKLLDYLAKNKHLTPFEHCMLSVNIKCPLYIRSQIHRHRTFCISGDSEISFEMPKRHKKGMRGTYKIPIKRLYENYLKWPERYQNMIIRVLNTKTNEFETSNISEVYYMGKNPIYKITLEDGKTLKCTENHKLYTKDGFKTLKDAVGLELSKNKIATMSKDCSVFTNGEFAWRDYSWMKNQRELGKSVQEIADNAGCAYDTVRKWLKIHNLQFDQVQVMINHTKKYGPWNKGKKGYKLNSYFSEESRKKIGDARRGEKNNFWKGGVTSKRESIGRWTTQIAHKVHQKYNFQCQECKEFGKELQAHHIVPVVEDPSLGKDFNNLISLCKSCHAKVHQKRGDYKEYKGKGNTLVPRLKKIVSIEYLGEEDTYDLGVEHESHNYIANGLVVHNSYNEISRRYTDEGIEIYEPEILRLQHEKSKQCSSDKELSSGVNSFLVNKINEQNKKSLELYNSLIDQGVAREMARAILPQSLMTEFYMTGNLRNWIHFLSLRLDSHSQEEVRSIAEQIQTIIKEKFPKSAECLFKY